MVIYQKDIDLDLICTFPLKELVQTKQLMLKFQFQEDYT